MIVETAGRKVAVLFDAGPGCPPGVRVLEGVTSAPRYHSEGRAVRIAVEIHRAHGGFRVRAMLGGVFRVRRATGWRSGRTTPPSRGISTALPTYLPSSARRRSRGCRGRLRASRAS
jgi:hypothetical protein